jgi:hypothetical protein
VETGELTEPFQRCLAHDDTLRKISELCRSKKSSKNSSVFRRDFVYSIPQLRRESKIMVNLVFNETPNFTNPHVPE